MQYMAIHAVPSDCSRTPGTGAAGTVEEADVVEPEEAPLEDVVPFGVLLVDPPREVDEHLVEHALQEVVVRWQALDGPRWVSVRHTVIAAQAWTGGFTSPKSHRRREAGRWGA